MIVSGWPGKPDYREWLRSLDADDRMREAVHLLAWWFDLDATAIADRDHITIAFIEEMGSSNE